MTAESFIADITASRYFKDNPGIVDKASIYRWLHLAMKSFGQSIMTKESKIVEVKNFRADLGKDFGGIKLAAWCKKEVAPEKDSKVEITGSYLYKERVENTKTKCGDEVCETEKVTSEKVYAKVDDVSYIYRDPVYVKLGRNVFGDRCSKGCVSNHESPYSLNIKGQEGHASFKEGHLYLEYYALPYLGDELLIPDSSLGYLEQYLEATVKRQIVEEALMSKDTPSLGTLFTYYLQKEEQLRGEAEKDVSPISLQSFWNLIDHNRKEYNKFQINLGR